MIDKGIGDKRSIWNPSNCECECHKSFGVGEYLDYENCKCREKLIDKSVEECSENELINDNTLIDHKKVCGSCERSSCTVFIVLFSVFLTISIGIGAVFVYFYWYSKNEVVNTNPRTETTIYWVQLRWMQFHGTCKWEISKT